MLEPRDYRPKIHFAPVENWINDPNGLIKIDNEYHLFAQHNPRAKIWGEMHWYHAKSKDLISWEHLPIAIYPDGLGTAFSGSGVYDKENISKLSFTEKPPIILFYTSHGEYQQQSIAYSTDGINFVKYKNNPIIRNNTHKNFRDPKVFYNEIYNCWSMTLSVGDKVFFYKSQDLINWEKTGEFGGEGNYLPGVWECTDMLKFNTDLGEKWVLIGSMTATNSSIGPSNTQYFIGDFNGDCFVNTDNFEDFERLDYGFDNYASVSFSNMEENIIMGWAMNWEYANEVPTTPYNGQMTLARKLKLINTEKKGLRLSSEALGYKNYLKNEGVKFTDKMNIQEETFLLEIKGKGESKIIISNDKDEEIVIGVDVHNRFYFDRSKGGINNFSDKFSDEKFSFTSTERFYTGEYNIKIIFDVSIIELFIDEGTKTITSVVYPQKRYEKITIIGDAEGLYTPIRDEGIYNEKNYDVVSLGEALIDFTPQVESSDVELYKANSGGAPLNVLVTVTKLGGKTAFIGKVGDDSFGKQITKTIKEFGINTDNVFYDKKNPTTLAVVSLDHKGERSFSFYRNPGADTMISKSEIDYEYIMNSKIFHFGSLSLTKEPSKSATEYALEIAKANKVIISFDPNLRFSLWESKEQMKTTVLQYIHFADILKLNLDEFCFLFNKDSIVMKNDLDYFRSVLSKIYNKYELTYLFITDGENGSYYYNHDFFSHISAYKIKSVDTTGAGDAFMGTILFEISKIIDKYNDIPENKLAEIVLKASVAGALTTSKYGGIPSIPDKEEVIKIANDYQLIKH